VRLHIILLVVVLLSAGCTMGPRYKRPVVTVPGSFRGAPEEGPRTAGHIATVIALGEQKWWDVFQDEDLRTLIRTSLQQNYDVRIAASPFSKHKRSSESRAPINFRP
jgi:outer membrane protein, multidrug efflux system